jgi:hypothetical protein
MAERLIVATPTGTTDVKLIERRGQFALTEHPNGGITVTHVPSGYDLPGCWHSVDTARGRRELSNLLVRLSDVPTFELADLPKVRAQLARALEAFQKGRAA